MKLNASVLATTFLATYLANRIAQQVYKSRQVLCQSLVRHILEAITYLQTIPYTDLAFQIQLFLKKCPQPIFVQSTPILFHNSHLGV